MARRPEGAAAFAAATLAFAVFTLWRYFAAALAPGLWATLLLAVIAAIATGAGLRALGFLGVEEPEPLAGATLGLGLLSLGVFALGVLGLLAPWAASAFLASLFFWGYAPLKDAARGANLGIDLWGGAAGLILAALLWAAWVPPHQYDSLVYHLTLPQAYVRSGRLAPVPHLLFSHFPQNGELLFCLALLFRCDVLAQLFMWLATALSAAWVVSEGRRIGVSPRLAALLLLTQTSVMLLSSTSYVEPLVMLWVTAAAFTYFAWEEKPEPGRLVLSAVFSGLALGTKYYAGISAAVLAGLLAHRKRWREAGLFTAVTGAVFAPWLVKNALTVGNPVFPFFYRWFPATGTGWNARSAEGYFKIMVEYGHKGGYLREFLSLPVLLLRNSLRFGGGMDVLGDLGWELGFWCLPLAVWAGRERRALRGLLAFGAGYFVLWFYTGVVLRFLTVVAPLIALLAAAGLERLWRELGRAGRAMLAAAVAVLTAAHLLLFGYVHAVFGSEKVLLGLEDREEFLAKRLDYYPCARYAREQFPQNDKILIVGEQRGYYVEQDQIATTVHAPNAFVSWANEAVSPRELSRRLRGEGIRHVLVVPSEALRLGPALGAFTERGLKNWRELTAGLMPQEFKAQGCVLYSPR